MQEPRDRVGASARPRGRQHGWLRWMAVSGAVALLSLVGARALTSKAVEALPFEDGERARPTDDFVDSIGVNIHLRYEDTSYARYGEVRRALLDLGVRHVRDGFTVGTPEVYERFLDLADAGIMTTFVMGAPDHGGRGDPFGDLDQLFDILTTDVLGAAEAVEGPNEMDLAELDDWAARTRDHQDALHRLVKGDERTQHLPVLAPSIGRSELRAPYSELGSVLDDVDLGNLHVYPGGRMLSDRVLERAIDHVQAVTPGLPIVLTETGYHQSLEATDQPEGHPAVAPGTAGILIPRILLESFDAGIDRTFLYELLDELDAPEVSEANYGLLTSSFSPKPAFTTLQNMIEILSDPGPSIETGSLSFRVDGGGDGLRSLLLQKRDGTFYLALWREEEADVEVRCDTDDGSQLVSLQIGQPVTDARLYRPSCALDGATLAISEAGEVRVPVSGEVRLLELRPDV